MILNEVEFDIAREFINIGLAKAADSMSIFVKDKIWIRSFGVQLQQLQEITQISEKDGELLVVLKTELQGDVGGVCFLIFNTDDVKKISEVSLPKSVLEDPVKAKEMTKAFLMELDNIVSAAVVTQFANILTLKVHGGIPAYSEYSSHEIDDELRKEISQGSSLLFARVNLGVEGTSLSPEFIWVLDEEFVLKVRSFIAEKDNQSIVEAMMGQSDQ